MATAPRSKLGRQVEYPTSDGKPMAETDYHRDLMVDLIQTLEVHFAADPMVYVSGNLLLFYEEGNKRRHISPDVLVTRGIPKRKRLYYLLWEEGKGPDMVMEITSKTTRSEDVKKKMALYRDVLAVPEYFLFDPFQDYLKPPMQGHRLIEGQYEPIAAAEGRLPSVVLGLHLERDGIQLRLVDPATGRRLLTSAERADDASARADHASARADHAEAEAARLRRELEELRRKAGI